LCREAPRDLRRRFIVARQSAADRIDEAKLDGVQDRCFDIGKSERVGKAKPIFLRPRPSASLYV
jgi:hypothetical protein